jgi:hypothetical protein
MINYGRILSEKEKDNPTTLARAMFIFSNAGDLFKCYRKWTKQDDLKNAYMKEMELALGDMLVQCEIASNEHDFRDNIGCKPWELGPHYQEDDKELVIGLIASHCGKIVATANQWHGQGWRFGNYDFKYYICETYTWTMQLCKLLELDVDDIRHLGFIHTIEKLRDDIK